MSYVSVAAHRTMALDRVRNDAYAAALARVITPTSVVLDLGAGTGVHGLLAARLGARRVYLVEPEEIIELARASVTANGLGDVVQCIQDRIEDVQLDESVDVIVSAMTGNVLVGEDLLPILFRARDRWLKPDGSMVPAAARVVAAPVCAPGLHQREVAGWSADQHGITLTAVRPYAANSLHYRWPRAEVQYLAPSVTLHTVDLRRDGYDGIHAEAAFVTQPGLCHGFAAWFDLQLGDRWVSTGPHAPATHWSPAFLPLDPPVTLPPAAGVTFRIDRPPFGEWTWRATWPDGSQRHSTLCGAPATVATIAKAALDYRPQLTREGEATAFVLSRCEGSRTVREIADELRRWRPAAFDSDADACRFVQSTIRRLA
jgi:hypothetical protein